MKRLTVLALLLASCGGSEEENADKDHAAAKATWCFVLKIDGADVRIPLSEMNILLFKDDEVASKNPTVFEIKGEGVHLIGEIPPAGNPGYGENIERMVGHTLTMSAVVAPGRTSAIARSMYSRARV